MASIQVHSTGILCRNPVPHLLSRHAYFPSVVQLEDGKLFAAMDIGQAFEAVDVHSYGCTSTDDGKTWSRPKKLFRPDESDHRVSTTCRVTKIADGSLVGLACLFDRPHTDVGMANPDTDGFVQTRFALIRSEDQGQTWSDSEPVELPLDWSAFETSSPIIPVSKSRWLLPTSLWANWEGENPQGHKGIVGVSDDAGQSWHAIVPTIDGSDESVTTWEQKIITLSDGRLMVVCWAHDMNAGENRNNRYAFSEDQGDSFTDPFDTPLQGETCTPVALADNHILCVYRRMDKKGLWAHLARIEGDTWIPLADQPLWGVNVQADAADGRNMLDQMSTLKFGCPSVIQLTDGQIFAAFWCVEEGVSSIRWLRMSANLGDE